MLVLVFFLAVPWWGSVPGQSMEIKAVHRVNDGDTFEADLNGNGRMDFPQERIRLLYVDTPALKESWKGQDVRHGIPAKDFLERALQARPLRLVIPSDRPFDVHGRTLAVARAGGQEVNLELVRQGLSPLDTRFSFPSAYDLYARAEGDAFQARRGIWREAASRRKYLLRLKREGRTPIAKSNALFASQVTEPAQVLASTAGKFIRISGRLGSRKALRNGALVLMVTGPGSDASLPVFISGRQERMLHTESWPPGTGLVVDGFVKRFKGRLELKAHHARIEPGI